MPRWHCVAKEALRAEVVTLEADNEDRQEMRERGTYGEPFVRRGDVYELRLPKGVGREQQGRRFG